jgi:transposase InsO family protein
MMMIIKRIPQFLQQFENSVAYASLIFLAVIPLDELLNRELFDTLLEAKVLTERWREEYNQVRSHSSLGYRPPAPQAVILAS